MQSSNTLHHGKKEGNARISWDTLQCCCISTQTQFRTTPQENKSASNIPQSFGSSSQELSVPRPSLGNGASSSFRN